MNLVSTGLKKQRLLNQNIDQYKFRRATNQFRGDQMLWGGMRRTYPPCNFFQIFIIIVHNVYYH